MLKDFERQRHSVRTQTIMPLFHKNEVQFSNLYMKTNNFAADDIPVWRSDLHIMTSGQKSSLKNIGVNALCVGKCDAESLATHGFWWTNRSAKRRHTKNRMKESNDNGDAMPILKEKVLKTSKGNVRPVHGVGVIYYFDQRGMC